MVGARGSALTSTLVASGSAVMVRRGRLGGKKRGIEGATGPQASQLPLLPAGCRDLDYAPRILPWAEPFRPGVRLTVVDQAPVLENLRLPSPAASLAKTRATQTGLQFFASRVTPETFVIDDVEQCTPFVRLVRQAPTK